MSEVLLRVEELPVEAAGNRLSVATRREVAWPVVRLSEPAKVEEYRLSRRVNS